MAPGAKVLGHMGHCRVSTVLVSIGLPSSDKVTFAVASLVEDWIWASSLVDGIGAEAAGGLLVGCGTRGWLVTTSSNGGRFVSMLEPTGITGSSSF